MQKIFLSSILLVFLYTCSNQSFQNDWERMNLNNKVKNFYENTFEAEAFFEEVKKGSKISSGFNKRYNYYYEFDNLGNKIIENKFDQKSILITKEIFHYEKNIKTKSEIFDKEDNKLLFNEFYNNNTETSIKSYKKDELKNTVKITFDNKGNRKEMKIFNPDKILKQRVVYNFNKQNKLKEQKRYNSNNKLSFRHLFNYNENGDKSEYKLLNADDKSIYTYTYKYNYDKHNNWIKKTEYKNGKVIYLVERTYDYFK